MQYSLVPIRHWPSSKAQALGMTPNPQAEEFLPFLFLYLLGIDLVAKDDCFFFPVGLILPFRREHYLQWV